MRIFLLDYNLRFRDSHQIMIYSVQIATVLKIISIKKFGLWLNPSKGFEDPPHPCIKMYAILFFSILSLRLRHFTSF